MVLVVIGNQESVLAPELSKHLNAPFYSYYTKKFADSETVVTLSSHSFIGQDVLIFFQINRDQSAGNVNDQLMGLLNCIHQIKVLNPKSLSLLTPYLPYARQDFTKEKRFPGAIFMIGQCLKAVGVEQVFSVELHEPDIIQSFPLPLHHLSTATFWSDFISKNIIQHNSNNFCIVSPDAGGKQRAEKIAQQLGLPVAYFNKTRVGSNKPVIDQLQGDVKGKSVILIDDILDTAQTAVEACAQLQNAGAAGVIGCFTHAVLSPGAIERLNTSCFKQIFVTDTVQHSSNPDKKISTISIASWLASEMVLFNS